MAQHRQNEMAITTHNLLLSEDDGRSFRLAMLDAAGKLCLCQEFEAFFNSKGFVRVAEDRAVQGR